SCRLVHALLHDNPMSIVRDDEAMEVELESVLDGGAVHLGYEATCFRQGVTVDPDLISDCQQFTRRLTCLPAAAAAHMQPKLFLQRSQAALERAKHACGDARGVPVHSHDGSEGLEPEGMCEPPEEFLAAIVMDDGFRNDSPEAGHAVGEP